MPAHVAARTEDQRSAKLQISEQQLGGPLRLAYLVSHPIQYQAPLLRRIAKEPDIELTVLFGSDLSVRRYRDEGFGVDVAWDVPLLEGYRSEFLPARRDTGRISVTSPLSKGLYRRLQLPDSRPAFDALWVHGYASLNALQGILAAKALGIPVLLRAEGWLGDRERGRLTRAARRLFFAALRPAVAAVLPIGTLNAESWRECFGSGMAQFPMPYAVDNRHFAERAEAADLDALRRELGLAPGRRVILFASKLQPRKHCDHLIAAYARLIAGRTEAETPYLLIAGDGTERGRLEAQTRELGLDGIRFCGFRNQGELPGLFALADVFVLPSRHEPWGLVVNEAMAAGCAVIVSSDVGCHADLVTDGVEGFVFPAGDIPALTLALDRVLATPQTAAAMGEAAQRRMATWSFEEDVAGLRDALVSVKGARRVISDKGQGTRDK